MPPRVPAQEAPSLNETAFTPGSGQRPNIPTVASGADRQISNFMKAREEAEKRAQDVELDARFGEVMEMAGKNQQEMDKLEGFNAAGKSSEFIAKSNASKSAQGLNSILAKHYNGKKEGERIQRFLDRNRRILEGKEFNKIKAGQIKSTNQAIDMYTKQISQMRRNPDDAIGAYKDRDRQLRKMANLQGIDPIIAEKKIFTDNLDTATKEIIALFKADAPVEAKNMARAFWSEYIRTKKPKKMDKGPSRSPQGAVDEGGPSRTPQGTVDSEGAKVPSREPQSLDAQTNREIDADEREFEKWFSQFEKEKKVKITDDALAQAWFDANPGLSIQEQRVGASKIPDVKQQKAVFGVIEKRDKNAKEALSTDIEEFRKTVGAMIRDYKIKGILTGKGLVDLLPVDEYNWAVKNVPPDELSAMESQLKGASEKDSAFNVIKYRKKGKDEVKAAFESPSLVKELYTNLNAADFKKLYEWATSGGESFDGSIGAISKAYKDATTIDVPADEVRGLADAFREFHGNFKDKDGNPRPIGEAMRAFSEFYTVKDKEGEVSILDESIVTKKDGKLTMEVSQLDRLTKNKTFQRVIGPKAEEYRRKYGIRINSLDEEERARFYTLVMRGDEEIIKEEFGD